MSPTCFRPAPLLARPVDDRRPAHGRGARRRRRDRRRDRVRHQQRRRPGRRAGRRLARRCRRREHARRRHVRRHDESVRAFHQVVLVCAALVAAGGIAGIIGITNPRRAVEAERCGGQLYGVPEPAVEHVRASRVTSETSPTSGDVMEDPQIHGTIEQLVAGSTSSGGASRKGTRARPTGGAWRSSRSRSTSAGTSCANAAPSGKLVVTPSSQRQAGRGGRALPAVAPLDEAGGQRNGGVAVLRADGGARSVQTPLREFLRTETGGAAACGARPSRRSHG